MLPSTSSPVESASTPASLTDTLGCSADYLGSKNLVHMADVQKENFQIPAKANFGMCGTQEMQGERGDEVMPPPDICNDKGLLHCDASQQRPSSRSSDEAAEDAIAQAVCDTKFVTNLSQIEGVCEDLVDEEELGAWGKAASVPTEPQDSMNEMLRESAAVSSTSCLPDLCDTTRGIHSKMVVDSDMIECNVASSISEEVDMINHDDASCVGDSVVSEEQSGLCNNDRIDLSEADADGVGSSAEDDTGSRSACQETADANIPESVDDSETQETSDSGCLPMSRDLTSDNSVGYATECVGPIEDYLIHDNQQISLVACGITRCDPSVQQDVEMTDVLEEDNCTGVDLIRHNLHHSSHPMFLKWPCVFYITEEQLTNLSVDSHGRHIGSEAAPMFFPSPSVSRPASQLTEEEQVKIAKRMGLITHLPCGIYDGSKKSGECVICMIDFTVGDRVRYLPCMHTYHTECIDDWLMRSFTCPSCLEPVDAALLNTYGTS
ncbi:uncharacterized protein LOC135217188 [Macrobrachium nipponense]|uniref:uncharacterized protein LOC135217188 n=1 Tax=Macrobrachium nipponense TaxID=159736 RepID=UPI0030C7A2F6